MNIHVYTYYYIIKSTCTGTHPMWIFVWYQHMCKLLTFQNIE